MQAVRKITLKELVAIRYIEKEIPWILEFDSKFDASQSVKIIDVYSMKNVSNFHAYMHRMNKSYVYRASFIHKEKKYTFRVSKGFFYSIPSVKGDVTIEFTMYMGYEVLLGIKGVVDYVEIYKYLHLQKNILDKNLRAIESKKATKDEKKEFNFQFLDAASTLAILVFYPLFIADSFLNPVLSLWSLPPLLFLVWFFFSIKKRIKYYKKSKKYRIKGVLFFNETTGMYNLDNIVLTLSKSWKEFFKEYLKKERGYKVELEGFTHHDEASQLSFQPISLKIGEYKVNYKTLRSFKHPFMTMLIAITLYFSLFTFDYQSFFKNNWNKIQILMVEEQVFNKNNSIFEASLIPHQEVEFKAYPIPIIEKDKLFVIQGYRLIDERSNIENIYPKIEDTFLNSICKVDEMFSQMSKSFLRFDKIVFKFHESAHEFDALTLDNRNYTKEILSYLKSSKFNKFQNYMAFKIMLEKRLSILEKLVIEQNSKRDAYAYIGTLRVKVHELDKKLFKIYKDMRVEYLPFLKRGLESYVKRLELFELGQYKKEALMKPDYLKTRRSEMDNDSKINKIDEYINYLNKLKTIPTLTEVKGIVKRVTFGDKRYLFIDKGGVVLKDVYWHLFMLFIWFVCLFVLLWTLFLSIYRIGRYLYFQMINILFKQTNNQEKIVHNFALNSLSIPSREKGKKDYEALIVIAVIVGVLLVSFIGIALKKTPKESNYSRGNNESYYINESNQFLGSKIE